MDRRYQEIPGIDMYKHFSHLKASSRESLFQDFGWKLAGIRLGCK